MHLVTTLFAGLVLWLLAAAGPALALCSGQDLIAALPAADRAALEQRSAARPFARGNLWRATRGDQVIVLAGTYHLPDPRHEALLNRLLPLLETATTLLVEAGPEEEAQLKAAFGKRPELMMALHGPTLPEDLDEADWQAVAAQMAARGVPAVVTSRMRPWYVAMMLGMPPCAITGVRQGEQGLDHRLIAAAQARGLPIQALEPYDTLFQMFSDLPRDGELDMVRAALVMADRPEDMAVTLANAYFAGQSQLLWDFTLDRALADPAADGAELRRQFDLTAEVVMTRRNRSWIPVLLDAAARGPVVAAFGALHLPGDDGIPALLAAEGFTIVPLD